MTAPLRLRPFRRLIGAYAVNALGTWVGEIALSILVLRETGSPAAVASVWVLGLFLPSAVGPWLVARLETIRSRAVLPSLLAFEAAVFAALAALCAHGFSPVPVLTLVFLDGAVALAVRALLKSAIVDTTGPRGLLREGNAVLTTVFTGCMAIGPVVGGVVVGFSSPETALAIDAVSFALAAVLLSRSGVARAANAGSATRRRLRDALAYVRGEVELRRLLAASAAVCLLGAAILPIEVVLVTDTIGASEAAYGTVLALWGAGAVCGSALVPLLHRVPLRGLMVGSFAVCALSYLGMGSAGSVEVVCLFSLVGGVSNGVEAYATMTAIQEATSQERQAPVCGLVESIVSGATGAGFLVGGAVASVASARATYVMAGLGMLGVAALMLALPRLSYGAPRTA